MLSNWLTGVSKKYEQKKNDKAIFFLVVCFLFESYTQGTKWLGTVFRLLMMMMMKMM